MTPAIGLPTDTVNHIKGRIGEAFVEALLRRANYSVSRVGRETHLPSLLKLARTTSYTPDFLAWREEHVSGADGERSLYNILAVEVKYRSQPDRFLRDEASKVFDAAQDDWPNFCVILLSDRFPDERSCFQVLRRRATAQIESVDIAAAGLDVFSTTAASFSGLLKQVFHALSDTAVNPER
jgi:hypothetical protein